MLRQFFLPLLILRSCYLLLSEPVLLRCLLLPVIFGVLSFIAAFVAGWNLLDGAASALMAYFPDWLSFLEIVLRFLITSAGAAIAATLVVTIGFSFYLEQFILKTLEICNLPVPEDSRPLLQSILFGLKEDLKQALVLGLVSILFLACAFFPILLPVNIAGSAYLLGLRTLDVPFSTLMLPLKIRWKIARKQTFFLLTLGFIYFLILPIPFLPLIAPPVFYITVLLHLASPREKERFLEVLPPASFKTI